MGKEAGSQRAIGLPVAAGARKNPSSEKCAPAMVMCANAHHCEVRRRTVTHQGSVAFACVAPSGNDPDPYQEVPMRQLIIPAIAVAAFALLASFAPRNVAPTEMASLDVQAMTLASPALATSPHADAH